MTLWSNELIQLITILKCIFFNFYKIRKFSNSHVFVATKRKFTNNFNVFTINIVYLFLNVTKCIMFDLYNVIRKNHSVINNEQFVVVLVNTLALKAFLRQFLNQLLVIWFFIWIFYFLENAWRILKILFPNGEHIIFIIIMIKINSY